MRYRHLDVTSASQWTEAIKATLSTYGKLDVLVNNAGISVAARVEDLSEAEWDAELAVHAKGVFLGTRAAIPAMRAGGGGSIINISSIMGIVGSPTSPAYSAAKGAIRIFTKSTALQYARENIRVNSVHPGYADTPMTREVFAPGESARGAAPPDPDAAARHRRGHRLGNRLPRERRVGLRHRVGAGDRRRDDRAVAAFRSRAVPGTQPRREAGRLFQYENGSAHPIRRREGRRARTRSGGAWSESRMRSRRTSRDAAGTTT